MTKICYNSLSNEMFHSGFHKHEASDTHKSAMESWTERTLRTSTDSSIDRILERPDPEHRTWLHIVFRVIQFLVLNGLPLRGDEEYTDFEDGNVSGGLFLSSLSDLLFKIDPNLETIARRLPENAKYTSPDIQNEVVEVLYSIVQREIVDKCRKAGAFTVILDGTESRNQDEMEAVVLRFWNESEAVEHVINVEHAEDRTAKGLLTILMKTLSQNNLSTDGITSDCLDGASVNSGWRGWFM